MDTVVKITEQTITKYDMLESGQKVLIGLSGGSDSTSMLLILLALKKQFKIRLIAAHLNHRLRGSESDKDQDYVQRLAKRFRIPFYHRRVDVPALAREKKASLEETARQARYQFFLEIARQVDARRVAVAHTADDQAETVMMRIIYGTGLRGLAGIKPVRPLDGLKVIRPLIELSRAQLVIFLKKRRYCPRFDSSNLDLNIVRNRIRYDLLPRMEKRYNPAIKEGLRRLSRQLSEGYDYLRTAAEHHLKKATFRKANNVHVLNIERISDLHPAVRSEIIRLVIENIKGDLRRVVYQNLLDVEKILNGEGGWACLNLPGGITVTRQYNCLSFYAPGHQPDKLNAEKISRLAMVHLPAIIKVSGITNIKEIGIKIKTHIIEDIKKLKFKKPLDVQQGIGRYKCSRPGMFPISPGFPAGNQEYFDYYKLKFPLQVRLKKPADRIKPLGLKKTKKVKEIFINQKIPAHIRPLIPLILSGNKIVWLCGVCISEEFKITPQTRKVLKITCQKI